jgi:hypothetical protein
MVQLVSVPLFFDILVERTVWRWILISSIPAYLALGGSGFADRRLQQSPETTGLGTQDKIQGFGEIDGGHRHQIAKRSSRRKNKS